jgi:hypothetical protein
MAPTVHGTMQRVWKLGSTFARAGHETDGFDSTWHHAASMGKLVLRSRAQVMKISSSLASLSRLTVSIKQQFFLDVRRELTWLTPATPTSMLVARATLDPTKKQIVGTTQH